MYKLNLYYQIFFGFFLKVSIASFGRVSSTASSRITFRRSATTRKLINFIRKTQHKIRAQRICFGILNEIIAHYLVDIQALLQNIGRFETQYAFFFQNRHIKSGVPNPLSAVELGITAAVLITEVGGNTYFLWQTKRNISCFRPIPSLVVAVVVACDSLRIALSLSDKFAIFASVV